MIEDPYEWVMTRLSEDAKVGIIGTIAQEVRATHLFSDCITEPQSQDLNSYVDMLMRLSAEEAAEQLNESEERALFRQEIYVHDLVKIMHDARRAGLPIAMYPTERPDYLDAMALIWDYYGDNPDELNDCVADALRFFEEDYKADQDVIYRFPGLLRLVMEQRAKTIFANLRLFSGKEAVLSVNPYQSLEVLKRHEHDLGIYELTIGIEEKPILVQGNLPKRLRGAMEGLKSRLEDSCFDISYS
jgi:hypothetical protein